MQEDHEYKFKGTWLPAAVHKLFEQGSISANDMVLLSTIDALSGDEPCWASNEWLGSRMNMKPNSVGDAITRLVRMGLLERTIAKTQTGTKRALRVWYDTTPVETGVRTPVANGVLAFPSERLLKNKDGTRHSCASDGDENMKGFFEQFETKSTIDPIYQECAGKLYKTLKAQGLLPRRYSPKRWASDIRIIFERVGQERAQKTFEYLLLNIRAKRMPVVRSGKSFKDKFESIEMHMNISQGKSKNLQVEVGDRARRIADLVKVKGWPKGVGSDLPAVAQISLDRYEQFVQDIYKLDLDAIDMPKIKRQQLSSLIDHLKFAFPQSAHFVEKWLLGVFDRVADWQGWSGDLMAMAFSPDSKHFRLDGRSWTRSYCGEPERWDLLMEVLNARQ